ncbi:ATP-binding protein [Exiguobacterium sp. s168]|uniref:ATP-binding protein n=1 Tax=Exiguobacterium sp. s168 TaxID=2751194 RepID=UPI001BEC2118|nr:ATP-binding protein [Exiguobacterium sp. s168]
MEELQFTIEDSELAELLGRQNFSTKESAVFELVKNAYDSGSITCDILFEDNSIFITDNGVGMSAEDIKKSWMHVGRSNKGYMDEKSQRVLTGSKGVGRFALARLGNEAKVLSKKEKHKSIVWETDWSKSNLNETEIPIDKSGTKIHIKNLRDNWKEKDIQKLVDFLRKAYKSNQMQIKIQFKNQSYEINSIFSDLKVGRDYISKISIKYDNNIQKLEIIIDSDEFNMSVENILKNKDFLYYKNVYDLKNENFINEDISNHMKINLLREVGEFNAELFFILEKTTKDNAEKFEYKYNNLIGPNIGIALYRNHFSIASHEGTKDWLNITERATKSPAAATHPTGSWRVRKNQIYGIINIDKVKNEKLVDLANRQGLDENIHYELFKEIINFGISRFENYRQTIIRKINSNNIVENKQEKNNKNLNAFLKKPDRIVEMSKEEIASIAGQIKVIRKEVIESKKVFKESEEKHKYDVRILNVLSTQGLRASAIAHDLHNKNNALSSGFEDIEDALIEYGFWDKLNSEEFTLHSYKNVPKILSDLKDINLRLMTFLAIILNKVEKKKFATKIESVSDVLDNIKSSWENQYRWVNIITDISENAENQYNISEDVLEVIFDNLILNSIQHNDLKGSLDIRIKMICGENAINVEYTDNGNGLNDKYVNDPFRILDVHETSRMDGHGLGMWIINNTLYAYKGKFIDISGGNGFRTQFTLQGRMK